MLMFWELNHSNLQPCAWNQNLTQMCTLQRASFEVKGTRLCIQYNSVFASTFIRLIKLGAICNQFHTALKLKWVGMQLSRLWPSMHLQGGQDLGHKCSGKWTRNMSMWIFCLYLTAAEHICNYSQLNEEPQAVSSLARRSFLSGPCRTEKHRLSHGMGVGGGGHIYTMERM